MNEPYIYVAGIAAVGFAAGLAGLYLARQERSALLQEAQAKESDETREAEAWITETLTVELAHLERALPEQRAEVREVAPVGRSPHEAAMARYADALRAAPGVLHGLREIRC